MNRRSFLLASSGVCAAAAFGSDAPPHGKLGLNTYCLRALKWRDKELLDYAAGLKLDGVFLQDSLDPEINDLAHWREVGAYARQLGLHIETGIGAVLPKDSASFEASRTQLLLGIQRARAVGSPFVRCLHAADRAHLPPGTIEQHRETMVKVLRSVKPQAVDAGLKFAIENHKDLQAWEMREVIEAAGPDFVGSYLETGNPVYVMEDPLVTLEHLGQYALCVHLRDSVIYETPGGAMVQWVPLGEGTIDFPEFVKRLRKIKPEAYVYVKPITGRPPDRIAWSEREFWNSYPHARAAEFARFLDLARRGRPYEKPIVIEDLPGKPMPEPFIAAVRFQQREHMERSVAYAKQRLDLGERWRAYNDASR